MTLDELLAREGVRKTMHAYNIAGDSARADEFAATFTEDAIFETENFYQEGRRQIHAWISDWGKPKPGAAPQRPVKFVRHNLTTSKIEITGPDTAKARSYFLVFTDIGPDHCGYYTDAFRKVGDDWLISHRKVRLDWRSKESTFGLTPAS